MTEILDVIRNTIYQFFDVCGDDEEAPMSDKDKLLLKVNKAICNNLKALDQEPCEDAISRQAVLEYIEASDAELRHSSENELVCQDIKEMPPVAPQPKMEQWIPVSEKPKEEGSYMTTLDYGEYGLVAGQRYYHGEDYGWSDVCVIAWMPLPEPYKPQERKNR